MKLIRGVHNLSAKKIGQGSVLTVGAYDGLHRGHQAVLEHLVGVAAKRKTSSVVLTFEPLPREYFAPLEAPARLMSFREKIEGLAELGIDCVLVMRFNKAMRNMEATEFIEKVFMAGLDCQHVVIGDDFRFGRDGSGSFDLLQQLGALHGFTVESTASQLLDDERVSSTRIRELLEKSEFAQAEALLGRPYSISGQVVYGQQLGRTIGVPTANVQLHRLRAAMSGVYAVEVQVEKGDECEASDWQAGVANVGTRPTVNDSIKAILEVHLLDFEGDLYGKRITVRFRRKMREEQKFDSLNALKQQIYRDVENARIWFRL